MIISLEVKQENKVQKVHQTQGASKKAGAVQLSPEGGGNAFSGLAQLWDRHSLFILAPSLGGDRATDSVRPEPPPPRVQVLVKSGRNLHLTR